MKFATPMFVILVFALSFGGVHGEQQESANDFKDQSNERLNNLDSYVRFYEANQDLVGGEAGESLLDGFHLNSSNQSGSYETLNSFADVRSTTSDLESIPVVDVIRGDENDLSFYRPREENVPEPYGLSFVGMGMVFLLMAYVLARRPTEQE